MIAIYMVKANNFLASYYANLWGIRYWML